MSLNSLFNHALSLADAVTQVPGRTAVESTYCAYTVIADVYLHVSNIGEIEEPRYVVAERKWSVQGRWTPHIDGEDSGVVPDDDDPTVHGPIGGECRRGGMTFWPSATAAIVFMGSEIK